MSCGPPLSRASGAGVGRGSRLGSGEPTAPQGPYLLPFSCSGTGGFWFCVYFLVLAPGLRLHSPAALELWASRNVHWGELRKIKHSQEPGPCAGCLLLLQEQLTGHQPVCRLPLSPDAGCNRLGDFLGPLQKPSILIGPSKSPICRRCFSLLPSTHSKIQEM